MKKVLILTYYWPPSGGAGVQRWLKFVKYLRSFGWEPVVYTVEDGEMPVVDNSLEKDIPAGITVLKQPIWEPYDLYKKFRGRKKDDKINASFLNEHKKTGITEKISIWIRGNFFIPDARRFWIRPSARYLSGYIRKEGITHIISSGPPHSIHLIALHLKKQFPSLRWIADFRDPWTNIDFYDQLMLTFPADRKHRRLEKRVLVHCDRVLSVGNVMSAEFAQMVKATGQPPEKCAVITNGYDSDDLRKTPVIKDEKFSIAHIGTLVKDRNPEVLWRVLQRLVAVNPDFAERLEIKLVGKIDIHVTDRLEKHGLSKYVRRITYLPHDEVIEEQRRSHVLLLLINNTRNARGILTGKFFEYMASGVPVLAIGPEDGDAAGIIAETGCGYISGFDNDTLLHEQLIALFNGQQPARNTSAIERFSRKELTGELAALLDELS